MGTAKTASAELKVIESQNSFMTKLNGRMPILDGRGDVFNGDRNAWFGQIQSSNGRVWQNLCARRKAGCRLRYPKAVTSNTCYRNSRWRPSARPIRALIRSSKPGRRLMTWKVDGLASSILGCWRAKTLSSMRKAPGLAQTNPHPS